MKSTPRVLASTTGLRFVVLASALVTNVVTARALGAAGRGDYQTILSVTAITVVLCTLSIDLATSRLFAAQTEANERRRIMGAAIGATMIGATVAAILALTILLAAPLLQDSLTSGFAVAVAGLALATGLKTCTQRLLFLTAHPTRAALAAVLESLWTVAAATTLTAIGHLDVPLMVAVTFVGAGLSVVTAVTSASVPRPRWLPRKMRALAWTGLTFHPAQFGLTLLVQMEVLLLAVLSTSQQVGVYGVAFALSAPLDVFALAVSTTFLNRIFASAASDSAVQSQRLVRMNALVMVPSALALALAAPVVVPLLWGQEFVASVTALWLTLPGVVLLAMQRPLGQYFVRQGMAKAMTTRVGLALAVKIVAALLLIPHYGADGAAVTLTLGYLTYTGLTVVAFARETDTAIGRVVRACCPSFRDSLSALRRSSHDVTHVKGSS